MVTRTPEILSIFTIKKTVSIQYNIWVPEKTNAQTTQVLR